MVVSLQLQKCCLKSHWHLLLFCTNASTNLWFGCTDANLQLDILGEF